MEKVKAIVLYRKDGKALKVFKNKAAAQDYCVNKLICNAGWVTRSLETGEKFYHVPNGVSISHSGYKGVGYYVKWKEVNAKYLTDNKTNELSTTDTD